MRKRWEAEDLENLLTKSIDELVNYTPNKKEKT